MNPKNHLAYYSRIYPSAWKQVDQFRADRGKSLPFWPDWCFLPLAGAYAIIMAEAKAQGVLATKEEILPLMNDVSIVGALALVDAAERFWQANTGSMEDEDIRKLFGVAIAGD